MADFPTLSRQPIKGVRVGFNNSGDVKHEDDAGYITSRRRYTRMPRLFNFGLKALDCDDYVLLSNFINSVTTVSSFNWTNPVDATVYVVRFKSVPVLISSPPFHSTTIELEEV